jgi:hypothetical protein
MKIIHLKTKQTAKRVENKVISLFKQKAFCLKTFNQLHVPGLIA